MLINVYTEVIMSHNQKSPHRGELAAPDRIERGHNASCGDDLTLMVTLEGDVISDAKFLGTGCAISTAAMSIMIDLIKGKTLEHAKKLTDLYLGMIKGDAVSIEDQRLLKDALAFSGIKDMPARVKCATLGWHCLKVIVNS
jgi:nitrogen fixation NifU-like protein